MPTLSQLLQLAHRGRDPSPDFGRLSRELGSAGLRVTVSLGITEQSLGSGFRYLATLGSVDDMAELGRPVVERDGHLWRLGFGSPVGSSPKRAPVSNKTSTGTQQATGGWTVWSMDGATE